MKLYLQDRQKIIDMPREVWMTGNGVNYCIMGTSYISPVLAVYDNEKTAKEVLSKMFEYYRNGKNSYILPEK